MPATLPDTGAPFIIGYDQGNIAFPIVAIQYDQQVGPGQVRPVLGTAASANLACPGASAFPASYVLVGVTTMVPERRMQWVYRILPGAWSAPKETPADDGAIVTTTTRDNIGANIVAQDELGAGINMVTSAEPMDSFLSKEVLTSRAIDGPPYTTLSYSERGDAISTAIEHVNPSESLPANAFGLDITREPGTLHHARQTSISTPFYDWTYSSIPDATTGIVGDVYKTFVAASQSNQGGIFIGPEVVNGKTFGSSGDLVIVEYQDDNVIKMQALIVTVFSASAVEAIRIGPYPIEGGYPMPPVLNDIRTFADEAVSAGVSTGTGNWEWHWKNEVGATVGMSHLHFPDKLLGTSQVQYFVGTMPSLSSLGITPTQLFASSGDCVVTVFGSEANESSYANDTASGTGAGSSTSIRYEVTSLPASIDTVSVPSSFGGGGGFGTGVILKPATSPLPTTITEVSVEVMKYTKLFRLEVIEWTVPTPP